MSSDTQAGRPPTPALSRGTLPVAHSAFSSEHTAKLKHTDFLIFNILDFEKWQSQVFIIFAIHLMVYLARL